MKTKNQFWTLLKFQIHQNPSSLVFIPIFFLMASFPLLFGRTSLFSIEWPQNIFLLVFLGAAQVLAPGVMGRSQSAAIGDFSEFMITRAIDRLTLCRVRLIHLLLIILPCSILGLLYSLVYPALKLDEYSKIVREEIVRSLNGVDPGNLHSAILVPHGLIIYELWTLWLFIMVAIFLEAFVTMITPLSFRTWIFYSAMALVGCGIPMMTIGHEQNILQGCFFEFGAHPGLFYLSILLALPVHFWCERRFLQREF